MNRFRIIAIGISTAVWCLTLLSPAPASAHKVSIFAWVEGDVVHTQSRFMDNRIPDAARVEVLDAAGQHLLQGTPDADGRFSFPAPYKGELKIILHGGPGHRAVWRLDAGDFDTQGGGANESHTHSHAPDTVTPSPERVVLTEEKIVEMVTDVLRREIEPLKQIVASPAKTEPTFRDIVGGIGFIFGLVGVVAYIRSRRKPRGPINKAKDR